jgi:hypothetical protein
MNKACSHMIYLCVLLRNEGVAFRALQMQPLRCLEVDKLMGLAPPVLQQHVVDPMHVGEDMQGGAAMHVQVIWMLSRMRVKKSSHRYGAMVREWRKEKVMRVPQWLGSCLQSR